MITPEIRTKAHAAAVACVAIARQRQATVAYALKALAPLPPPHRRTDPPVASLDDLAAAAQVRTAALTPAPWYETPVHGKPILFYDEVLTFLTAQPDGVSVRDVIRHFPGTNPPAVYQALSLIARHHPLTKWFVGRYMHYKIMPHST